MHELARVSLENEMDLILAHKRSMKLAELAGLSLSAQTTFATAVSEVSRNTICSGKSGCLILGVDSDHRKKYIVACIKDELSVFENSNQGLENAKKLVDKYKVTKEDSEISIELFYNFTPHFPINILKLDEWRSLFRNEPPISPYEEIKRKNELLQELSDKVQKKETQYKTLTNSLPLFIFSLNQDGQIFYANEWLLKFTGHTIESLNASEWKNIVHEEDYHAFSVLLKPVLIKGNDGIKMQTRFLNRKSGEYLWHQVSLSPVSSDNSEPPTWTGFIVDIHKQKIYEQTLKDNIELKQTQEQLKENQQMLEKYIEELSRSNNELQQFAFIASHDLQEPVRKFLFYTDFLSNSYSQYLDDKGIAYLSVMQNAAKRMRSLIKDLLTFSQINKGAISFEDVNLNEVAKEALQDFEILIKEKEAVIHLADLPQIKADRNMMMQLFGNIIGNALKFSTKDKPPQIEISCRLNPGSIVLAFKDNGIGFDEKFIPQMFTLFQRLHSRSNYEGTGLGLAICKKIVDLHQGQIWANASEAQGSTFHISLPLNINENYL